MDRNAIVAVIPAVILCVTMQAQAEWMIYSSPVNPVHLPPIDVLVPPGTSPGTILASVTESTVSSIAQLSSSSGGYEVMYVGTAGSTPAPYSDRSWEIGKSGLALRLRYDMLRRGQPLTHQLGEPTEPAKVSAWGAASDSFLFRVGVVADVVHMGGRIKPGQYNTPIVQVNMGLTPSRNDGQDSIPSTTVTVRAPSCDVTVGRHATFASPVGAWEFGGIGSTAGTASASINVQCSVASNATITWTANNTVANTIALKDGGAQGYGVVLYDEKDDPIELGREYRVAVPEEGQTYGVTARYIKTSNDTKAGRADATATVTVTAL